MKTCLIVVLMMALPLAAQEDKNAQPAQQLSEKLFILKHADPDHVSSLLRVFSVSIATDSRMHALTVRATDAKLQTIGEFIQQLDVPGAQPKDIELTVYYLSGNAAETTDGEAVPKDLDSVVAQLKTAFPYSHYRLMDVLTMRTRTGTQAEASSVGGRVAIPGGPQPIINQFRIQSADLSPDGATVRIEEMKAGERLPVATSAGFSYLDIGYNAHGLDIKEGQKAVVGRLGASQGQALFLVLQAHVIQ